MVTGSACDSPPWYYQHMALPENVNEKLAAAIRSEVGIPVVVAGRLGNPERIRTVLARGMADAIALGRPLLADPDLPRKMSLGREGEIMMCGSCLQGCLAEVKNGRPIGCIVNPETGGPVPVVEPASREGERLVVVGGGPAGMQTFPERPSVCFGPVPSRRLGQSLGVNTIPPKTCSYACVYCQLGRTTRMQASRQVFHPPDVVVEGVRSRLEECRRAGFLESLRPDVAYLAVPTRPPSSCDCSRRGRRSECSAITRSV